MFAGSLGGIDETFSDLFACLRCASNVEGNCHDKLFIAPMSDYVEYNPAEMPALVGLHGVCYTVISGLSEHFGLCVARLCVSRLMSFVCWRCGLQGTGG